MFWKCKCEGSGRYKSIEVDSCPDCDAQREECDVVKPEEISPANVGNGKKIFTVEVTETSLNHVHVIAPSRECAVSEAENLLSLNALKLRFKDVSCKVITGVKIV